MESKKKDVVTGIFLSNFSANYAQEGDSCGDGLCNSIEIKTEDAGGGRYYVLKTDRWAFESVEEFVEIINDFISKMQAGSILSKDDDID